MTRQRLPSRRPSVTTKLIYESTSYSVTLGYDVRNDRVAEMFTHDAKVGSAMDRMLDDICVALSLLLSSTASSRPPLLPAWDASVTGRLPPRSSALSPT